MFQDVYVRIVNTRVNEYKFMYIFMNTSPKT